MKRLISLTLLGTLLAGMLSGCSSTEADTGTADGGGGSEKYPKHTLAASIPLTGNLMQYGTSYQNALTMAVNDFNEAGGLDGEDVILEINDDKGDQKEAINLANKIIEEEDVFAVVGSYGSSVSMAAAPVYQKAAMPLVSPNTSHPDFPGMGDMMVPISPTADNERIPAAEVIYENFGGKLAIMHQNTDLGVTGAEVLKSTYEELGGEVIMVENFVPQQTKDFTPIISKIKAADPDVLYIDGEYNDLANILIQIQQIGLPDVQLFGPGNAFKQEFLDIAGDAANGIILVGTTPVYEQSILENSTEYSDYLKDFTKRYNELYPDTPCDGFAAAAYDAAMLAMTAARNAGTGDPHALVEEMLKAPIEIACGKTMHYENGNTLIKDVFMYTVEDGQFDAYSTEA